MNRAELGELIELETKAKLLGLKPGYHNIDGKRVFVVTPENVSELKSCHLDQFLIEEENVSTEVLGLAMSRLRPRLPRKSTVIISVEAKWADDWFRE